MLAGKSRSSALSPRSWPRSCGRLLGRECGWAPSAKSGGVGLFVALAEELWPALLLAQLFVWLFVWL